MLFFSVSSRFFVRLAWLFSRSVSLSVCVLFVLFCAFPLPFLFACGLLLLWFLCFVVLRAVCFVRFRRPASLFGLPASFGSVRLWRWSCVPLSSLPAVRSSRFVWAVRPAVVSRRSGVVLFVWVLWCPLPSAFGASAPHTPKRGCC